MARVVLVTGATGHLGSAVSKAFLEAGDSVVAVYRRDEALEALRASLGTLADRLVARKADASRPGEMDAVAAAVAKELGRIDALVATVGGYMTGAVESTTPEAFDRAVDLNLKSAFLACKAVLPFMRAQGRGKIVAVSSRQGLRGEKEAFLYSATKAGVIRLTESLAEEVKDAGIQVNCVVPKVLDTAENRAAMPKAKWDRWPTTDQVAHVILWLCSDEAEVVTGAAVPVFGRA